MPVRYLIIGAGSAGCILANRLSALPDNQVTLVEAGADFPPGQTPEDILDTYAGRALGNRSYFWDGFAIQRGNEECLGPQARKPVKYDQPRVIGGGSSINGQVSLRGLPSDFDAWHQLGATGWDWDGVLRYFRRLETDLHFTGELHGSDGPIPIRRFLRPDWDRFTSAIAHEWERAGFPYLPDMNGMFEDGFAPIPVSNDGAHRVSSADGYLTSEVRARPNLLVLSRTEAARLVFDGPRITGVEVLDGNRERRLLEADRVILSAGAFRTPWLLMASGIGPGRHLNARGVDVLLDRPGVGANLQDHALISISAYLSPLARANGASRRNFAYLRYTSGLAPGQSSDMVMMAVCRSSWHAIGRRIGTLTASLGYPYSRGSVSLPEPGAAAGPEVVFNWLQDARDRLRMSDAFHKIARLYEAQEVSRLALHPFPSGYTARARLIQRNTIGNAGLTRIGASLMDSSELVRKWIIRNLIQDSPPVAELLRDPDALAQHLCENTFSSYHPVGTCRMGRADDPLAVVDPGGLVIGTRNLYVADASVMPVITRSNTNLPVQMIGEKMADLIGLS